MNDTRKDARLSVALVTRYREPTMLEPREGECRDLSLSGMFITTQRPSPRGALIRFECVSDQPEDGFRGTGRVVWQRNKSDDRGPAGMGVRFVRLESGGREALERTIDRIGSVRPLSRTPRPSNRAPANARARQDEAAAHTAPIFAAGTASSSSTSHPVIATPLPPAQSTDTARFPHLRSSTLRGVAIPAEVKRASSNPPPDGARAGNTPLPLPPRTPQPPAPARGAAGPELRDRLDRTRRGVGPQAESESPASTGELAPAPAKADSERPTAEVTAPGGEKSDQTVDGASAAPRSDRPRRAAASSPAQNGAATSSAQERPARERQSDRPPRPGGTDDLRARAAQPAEPSGPPDAGSGPRPRDVAFARTTLKEVAVGLRTGTPVRSDPASNSAPTPRQLSANAAFPRAERDTTEKRIPIAGDIVRYERGSSPEFEQERGGSRWLLWVIAGSGLLMSYWIVRLFGGGLPDIPGETISTEVASSAKAASTNPTGQESHTPYVLAVTTQPAGARVSAAGLSLVAPGELHLDDFHPPLQVEAELAGYAKASATVWPSQFERNGNGNGYQGKLDLTLQPAANAAPAAATAPAAANAPAERAQPVQTKAHDSGRAATPARRSSAAAPEARRKDSQTAARRTTAKTTAATVVITPAAPSPPAPEGTGAPLVASPSPKESQQTPLAEALDCLGRGDNRCVIRALEDKASSAREFELLIETYRAVGSTPRAERQMQSYIERFPEGQRAPEYRRLLERRAQNPSGESAAPRQAP